MYKAILQSAVLITVGLSGCSATNLRCAVDGDSSFVEIYDIPSGFSQNTRAYSELCAFAYDGGNNETP